MEDILMLVERPAFTIQFIGIENRAFDIGFAKCDKRILSSPKGMQPSNVIAVKEKYEKKEEQLYIYT